MQEGIEEDRREVGNGLRHQTKDHGLDLLKSNGITEISNKERISCLYIRKSL